MSETQTNPEAQYAQMYEQPKPKVEGWVKELVEGDVQKAQKALEEQIAASVKPQIERDVAAVVRAELEVKSYLDELRAEMPDVRPLEPFVLASVTQQLVAQADRLKTPAEYVDAYKQAVKQEMERAREVVQQLRAAGKNEAMAVKEEVISSAITQASGETDKGAIAAQPEVKPQTPEEYYAQRMAALRRIRGMGA